MFEKLKLFFKEASTKVTTYVALAVAVFDQAADHAQGLLDIVPSLQPYLPESHTLSHILNGVTTVLGLIVIYTRVRRVLKS